MNRTRRLKNILMAVLVYLFVVNAYLVYFFVVFDTRGGSGIITPKQQEIYDRMDFCDEKYDRKLLQEICIIPLVQKQVLSQPSYYLLPFNIINGWLIDIIHN